MRARVFITSIHLSQSLGPFRVIKIFWDMDMVVLDVMSEDYSMISMLISGIYSEKHL
jgi:hypothetical protein